jgi:hypothetical protein
MKLAGYGDEDHLVGSLGQPVLLAQPPQVVQHALEQAEDLVLRRERPDQHNFILSLVCWLTTAVR